MTNEEYIEWVEGLLKTGKAEFMDLVIHYYDDEPLFTIEDSKDEFHSIKELEEFLGMYMKIKGITDILA